MPLKYMLLRRDNVMTDKKQQKARDEEELSKCPVAASMGLIPKANSSYVARDLPRLMQSYRWSQPGRWVF